MPGGGGRRLRRRTRDIALTTCFARVSSPGKFSDTREEEGVRTPHTKGTIEIVRGSDEGEPARLKFNETCIHDEISPET